MEQPRGALHGGGLAPHRKDNDMECIICNATIDDDLHELPMCELHYDHLTQDAYTAVEVAKKMYLQLVGLRTTIAQQQDTINRQRAELISAAELLEQADKRIDEAAAANNAALRKIQDTELRFDRYAANANRIEKIKDDRIAELERQLAATLTTIEAAAWCNRCNLPDDHCRENHDGRVYAEGCAP